MRQALTLRDPPPPPVRRAAPGFLRLAALQRLALPAAGAFYAVSVALLFASRMREFADETDNLLGGLLLARGERLYVDYFSSHMPLAYYVAAVPALFGARSLESFRPWTDLLLVVATLLLAWAFRRRLPLSVLLLAAALVVFTHTLQYAEMLTAGTLAAFGIALVALLAFTTPRLDFGLRESLLLSLGVFVAVQAELLSVYPLAVIGVCYVAMRLVDARPTGMLRQITRAARLLGIVLLPHLVVLVAMWLAGSLQDFVYDAYTFNQRYYAQFLMSGSPLGIAHDWESQYRTYLLQSLSSPFDVQGLLVLANVAAAVLVARQRGLFVGVAYYAFVALAHVRTEEPYYIASCFSLALVTWRSLGVVADAGRVQWRSALAGVAGLLLVGGLAVRVAGTYDLSGRGAREPGELPYILLLTQPGDRIWVAPYDPYEYLESGRMPASIYPFYFPWQAIDPRSQGRILQDLAEHPPALILFRADEIVNGHWAPGEYGQAVLQALAPRYAPLDPSAPVLRNLLVPRDRLPAARAAITAAGLGPEALSP